MLQEFEELFDGTLGTWQTPPVHLKLKEGATPYHGKAFPVPHIHKETLKKEVERLEEIGVLKRQTQSEWASPTFIIPKKQGTVRFISDFREVNKRIKRNPSLSQRLVLRSKSRRALPMHLLSILSWDIIT